MTHPTSGQFGQDVALTQNLHIFTVDLDLSPLAGQDVKFVLTVLSLGDASNDRALWVQPRIVRTPR